MTADQWWALLFLGSVPIACLILLLVDLVLGWIYAGADALEDVR